MSIDALRPATEAVAGAIRVARTVQQDLKRVQQITKDDRSPVTVADYAVQAIVALALRERAGAALIVGEEHAGFLRQAEHATVRDAVVDAVRMVRPDVGPDTVLDAIDACDHDGSGAAYWTLDPVDGTKGFLRGQQYAIALAHLEGGRVTMAAMGCPNMPTDWSLPFDVPDPGGAIYAAAVGEGSWQWAGDTLDSEPGPIRARHTGGDDSPRTVRICESVEAAHSRHGDTQRILDTLGYGVEYARLDSQCKYAVVARGQADAYLRMPTRKDYVEKIWDHAAGMLIATEAGAVVTDVSGAPLDFGHGRRLEANRGVVCAAAGVHGKIIEVIGALGIGDARSPMIRARTIATVAGIAGTVIAATALAAWLLGRVVSDRYGWSQWLLWIPTPAMVPVVLLGLAAAYRPAGKPGRRRRRLVAWGVVGAAVSLYFLVVEHRFARFGGGDRTGLTILHSAVYPGRRQVREAYVDRLIAAGADVTVLSNPLLPRDENRIEQEFGEPVTTVRIWPFRVISRLPVLEARPLVAHKQTRIALIRLDAGPQLGRTLNLYAVDLPSDPRLPRLEIARAARRMLDSVEAPPPDIVVGDFNMTRGSASVKALFPGLAHAFNRAGRGYGATFHRSLPLYHLDHTLLSDAVRATDYELVDLETGRHLAQRVVVAAP